MERLKAALPWDGAEEVTFECEPGTLQQHKLEALRELGVTRLSLGIENFDPKILESNGRAHLEDGDLPRLRLGARPRLRPDQHRPDRRHGRRDLGQLAAVRRARPSQLAPDSVTIYQMELPFNTVFSQELQVIGQDEPSPAAASPTGRPSGPGSITPSTRWRKAGYQVSSAYTLVKDKANVQVRLPRQPVARRRHVRHRRRLVRPRPAAFTCRTSIRGSSTSSCSTRASCRWAGPCRSSRHELLIREMILQLKTGRLEAGYFRRKFGSDILEDFADGFDQLRSRRLPDADGGRRRTDARRGCCRWTGCCRRSSSRSTGDALHMKSTDRQDA